MKKIFLFLASLVLALPAICQKVQDFDPFGVDFSFRNLFPIGSSDGGYKKAVLLPQNNAKNYFNPMVFIHMHYDYLIGKRGWGVRASYNGNFSEVRIISPFGISFIKEDIKVLKHPYYLTGGISYGAIATMVTEKSMYKSMGINVVPGSAWEFFLKSQVFNFSVQVEKGKHPKFYTAEILLPLYTPINKENRVVKISLGGFAETITGKGPVVGISCNNVSLLLGIAIHKKSEEQEYRSFNSCLLKLGVSL